MFIRDTWPVVGNGDIGCPAPLLRRDPDGGTFRSVLDRVVQKVNEQLHDQTGIRTDEDQFREWFHEDLMIWTEGAHMGNGFLQDVLQDFRGEAQLGLPVLKTGAGQEVFHHVVEPERVLINRTVERLPGGLVKTVSVGEQIAGISGDGGQRCPQVMGDGPQQGGAQPFILDLHSGGFPLPGVLLGLSGGIFQPHRKRAGDEGGQEQSQKPEKPRDSPAPEPEGRNADPQKSS